MASPRFPSRSERSDKSFRWLDRAISDHASPLEGIGMQVIFRPLHSDPRFAQLLRRIGLDPDRLLSKK